MPHVTDHPSDEALAAFALGRDDPPGGSALEEHLEACDRCLDRAEAVAPDALVALVASVHAGTDRSVAPTPTPGEGGTWPAAATRAWHGPPAADEADPPAGLAGHPKYRVVRRLGVGGMGSDWLAEHAVMNRPVAVKVIRPDLLARPGATARFLREVQAAARLHDPNIVTAFDAEPAGDSCLLVMEYVRGETLADRVAAGPLPAAEACRAARDAARGLAHAHAAGLVHRDVKPHNLIRAADGTVKVLDFGLAGVGAGGPSAAGGAGLTGAGMVMGTPGYIAPEQVADPHAADARADVYGLGCTLYHLLAGRPPFRAGSAAETLAAQVSRDPEPIPGLAPDLAAVLAKMLTKRPGDRYQTADAAAAALEAVLANVEGGRRPTRRRPRLAAAAGLVLAAALLAAAGAVFKVYRDNQEIAVTTDDPDVEVVMKRKGEVIRVIDHKSGQAWVIDAAANQIAQADRPDGLALPLPLPENEAVVLRREGKEVFRVTRARTNKAAPAPAPEEKVGEVRKFEGHLKWVPRVAFSRDGRLAISSGEAGAGGPLVWEIATGNPGRPLKTGRGGWGLSISPDGKRALCCEVGSNAVHLVELADGRVLKSLREHKGGIWGVVFLPDGKRAVSGGEDKTLRVWDLEAGSEVRQFEGVKEGVRCLALSPDGRRLAVGHYGNRDSGPGTLRVWDVETGREVRAPIRVPNPIHAVVFAPDGGHVLTGDRGGIGRIWDLGTGAEVKRFDRHYGPVEGVAFTPDGRVLTVGGTADGTLRVWDRNSGTLLHKFEGPGVGLLGVAVSPDGRHALTSGKDGSVRLWRLPDPPKP